LPRLREDIHIHAPQRDVYSHLRALDRYQRWLPRAFRDVRGDGATLDFTLALGLRSERGRLAVDVEEPHSYLELAGATLANGGQTAIDALAWYVSAEGPREVHLIAEARYEPRGVVGAMLELPLLRAQRRQVLRDMLWRLKHLVEGRGPDDA
jgi:hypothetical protein